MLKVSTTHRPSISCSFVTLPRVWRDLFSYPTLPLGSLFFLSPLSYTQSTAVPVRVEIFIWVTEGRLPCQIESFKG